MGARTRPAVFDGQVHFPDYRIEYEVDGRERHEDVELFTRALPRRPRRQPRPDRLPRSTSSAPAVVGVRSAPHPRVVEEFL